MLSFFAFCHLAIYLGRQNLMIRSVACCRAVIAESEKRNITGVLGEEIQTLHFQNRSLQEQVGM